MTLPTWATPFTDNVSVVSAAFLNSYVRTQIPKAIDGVGGGIYTPSDAIEIHCNEVEPRGRYLHGQLLPRPSVPSSKQGCFTTGLRQLIDRADAEGLGAGN